MKNRFLLLSIFLGALFFLTQLLHSAETHGQMPKHVKNAAAKQKIEYPPMPEPGRKVPLGGGHYMIYGFAKKPKLGVAIMKVTIFTEDGKPDTSFEVKAHADMPSMRGAHVTVDRSFKLSRKGEYLAPIDIVMPGDWEVNLTIIKDGKVVFRGRYNFDV